MTEMQTRPVGRPCRTCEHPQRSEIEQTLLSAERTVSAISSDYGLSLAGLRRHRDLHMTWPAQEATEAGLAPVEVVAQLIDLAARLDDALTDAEERRHPGDIARLALARERVLRTLSDRGVKPELVERNQELELNAKVLRTLLRVFPAVAEEAERQYRAAGYLSAANRVRTVFLETKELTAP